MKDFVKKIKKKLKDNFLWLYVKYDNIGALDTVKDVNSVLIPLKFHFNICNAHKFGDRFHKPWLLQIENAGCFWKDKYNTPRFEGTPYGIFGPSPRISITLFKWFKIIFWWQAPCDFRDEDTYWEMWLWYKYYCDSDINKAEKSWEWRDMDNKSTWKEEFVLPKWRNS